MTINYSMLNLSSDTAALKLVQEGSGSGTIPATGSPSDTHQRIVIPHGQGNDLLLFRVLIVIPGYPSFSDYFTVPFSVSGLFGTPSIDATNLYIEVGQSGFGLPAQDFQYYYRILIP